MISMKYPFGVELICEASLQSYQRAHNKKLSKHRDFA
jgi:hypothetical protein